MGGGGSGGRAALPTVGVTAHSWCAHRLAGTAGPGKSAQQQGAARQRQALGLPGNRQAHSRYDSLAHLLGRPARRQRPSPAEWVRGSGVQATVLTVAAADKCRGCDKPDQGPGGAAAAPCCSMAQQRSRHAPCIRAFHGWTAAGAICGRQRGREGVERLRLRPSTSWALQPLAAEDRSIGWHARSIGNSRAIRSAE